MTWLHTFALLSVLTTTPFLSATSSQTSSTPVKAGATQQYEAVKKTIEQFDAHLARSYQHQFRRAV